jgi:hypothetical protein
MGILLLHILCLVLLISKTVGKSHRYTSNTGGGSFCGYLMDNLPKVVIVAFVFLGALMLILARNRGGTNAILCVESVANELKQIPYPDLNLNRVSPRVDKGRYSAFNAEKWIIVAALGSPTHELQALVKIEGWQLLAVGGSETSADWKVEGALFLSLDQQVELGYRINAYLPFNSYLRKNAGYLFAIQHGATKIYDADEKATILGGDLGHVFDIELRGPNSRRDLLLQYRTLENRSVVNPFVHFGQRSVWPRGLPLDMVQQISPDVSYTQVFPGHQIIQQGLANGLPDVDSIFYSTRRAEDVAIDIEFDTLAPPVALPHGTMAPCNALNTLFHSAGFWGLLLPVSLTPKAADIVRGYWAQRILWEIGGMMVVYPPTVKRADVAEPSSFVDEADLYKESSRLIKFLVGWRSEKGTLFEKILHLSHEMAEQRFWGAQDVELVAAWLKDLLSVGWRQPRLRAVELGTIPVYSSPDEHKQFMPKAYPSVHLGIEDTTTMGSEFTEFLNLRRFYGNMVLVLECSYPLNHTVLAWRLLYGRLFKHVAVLSQEKEAALGVEATDMWMSYNVLPKIFERYPNAEGFMVMSEAVIFNYWHLASADKSKLWNLHVAKETWKTASFNDESSAWYLSKGHKNGVKKLVSRLPVEYRTNYRTVMDDDHFMVSSSKVYYVPRRYIDDFSTLAGLAGKQKLNSALALPLFFVAMENPENFDTYAFNNTRSLSESEVKEGPALIYTPNWHIMYPWKASSEFELYRIIKAMSAGDPSLSEILDSS